MGLYMNMFGKSSCIYIVYYIQRVRISVSNVCSVYYIIWTSCVYTMRIIYYYIMSNIVFGCKYFLSAISGAFEICRDAAGQSVHH